MKSTPIKKLKKAVKRLGLLIFLYVFLCLITPFNPLMRNRSIKNQINYLSGILDAGYDDELQRRFPEGKVFSNAILASSIITFCEKNAISKEKYAIRVDQCVKRMLSKEALKPFNAEMEPPFGMFYNGWTLYVLRQYEESKLFELSSIQNLVSQETNGIHQRLMEQQKDSVRILNTYPASNWPADNLIGLIAIDQDSIQQEWLQKILETSEHPSGLIHHSGSNQEKIRGSSQALITFCLKEIGYDQVEKYNHQFKDLFVEEFLGVQLVKENEDGSNRMDVDSGPVVWGYGASGTVMNVKTQASLGFKKARWSWAALNTIACPINGFGKKFYLLKKEPMLDIFLLWGSVEL